MSAGLTDLFFIGGAEEGILIALLVAAIVCTVAAIALWATFIVLSKKRKEAQGREPKELSASEPTQEAQTPEQSEQTPAPEQSEQTPAPEQTEQTSAPEQSEQTPTPEQPE